MSILLVCCHWDPSLHRPRLSDLSGLRPPSNSTFHSAVKVSITRLSGGLGTAGTPGSPPPLLVSSPGSPPSPSLYPPRRLRAQRYESTYLVSYLCAAARPPEPATATVPHRAPFPLHSSALIKSCCFVVKLTRKTTYLGLFPHTTTHPPSHPPFTPNSQSRRSPFPGPWMTRAVICPSLTPPLSHSLHLRPPLPLPFPPLLHVTSQTPSPHFPTNKTFCLKAIVPRCFRPVPGLPLSRGPL